MTVVDTNHSTYADTRTPTITVYSKPLCVQCDATKRELRKQKHEFAVLDITQDEDALAKVKALGHVAAPVVVLSIGDEIIEHWSKFQIDRLRAIPA